ncbi:rho-related GTP-binding protein RhoU isoform X1 [Salmo salar]|uniref:Rho-related GTP-binding protein RhoU isoform X1 n=1 Tax=Salmo salar TaxID=8030 RepID=A0A1S3L696_SALSA|nr:rho-related GTP-binding protein RhoU-like isoform X1 [Salmo salar]|eukprot:XP_013986501.1 PREDICTED: rho-related GTP-binding protein RhoU-like isoform X1 [Salmo salar]
MLPQDIRVQKPRRISDSAPPVPPRRGKNRDSPLSTRGWSGSVPGRNVNCVLVGDGAVGKTSLIVSYTTNGYPTEYIPTAFDNFAAMVVVDGKPVRLQLCDMAGQKWGMEDDTINDELDRIRPLCYHNADVFLLCYSVVRPSSFRNATDRWAPEIRHHCPGAPMVLVGTQLDLREDVQVLVQLARNRERPVGTEEAQQLAKDIGAVSFVECSGLTQKNLKEVFDQAILASIQQAENVQQLQQRQSLRKKTPDKIKSLSETWWKKLSCVVVAGECVGGEFV